MNRHGFTKFQAELLECLQPSIWKTYREVSETMGKARKAAGCRGLLLKCFSFLGEGRAEKFVLWAELGRVIYQLDQLERLGLVECRVRRFPRKRGTKKVVLEVCEFALTQRGLRVRRKLENEQ